tara:strand:+ start:289 stop:618 length:330 start_codon:yes stop_codon:yes gene_type:complete
MSVFDEPSRTRQGKKKEKQGLFSALKEKLGGSSGCLNCGPQYKDRFTSAGAQEHARHEDLKKKKAYTEGGFRLAGDELPPEQYAQRVKDYEALQGARGEEGMADNPMTG